MKRKNTNITEITVRLSDGRDLTFQPKYNPIIKVIKGISERSVGFFVDRFSNGEEALIIVCAPPEVQQLFDKDGDLSHQIEEELNKK